VKVVDYLANKIERLLSEHIITHTDFIEEVNERETVILVIFLVSIYHGTMLQHK